MNVIRKDATITNTDDEFPGAFEVVLSAPTLDRDGDTLLPDEWKTPLPDHITFDSDHGMSVATTVGSGAPEINDAGELIVRGTYSSLDRAQEVRTLVNEGHIRTTSVAFMTTRAKAAGGKQVVTRELLNGAFVAIPSNREAVILSSKGFNAKGVVNDYVPAPYDAAGEGSGEPVTCPNCGKGDALDAKYCDQCGFELEGADGVIVSTPSKGFKSGARNSASDAEHIQAIHDHAVALGATTDATKAARQVMTKSVAGSLEATQDRARDALQDAYPGFWVYLQATLPEGDGGTLVFQLENTDTYDCDSFKQTYTDDGSVITLTGERTAVDLMQVIKPDPDEDAEPANGDETPAAAKAAAAVESKAAANADSDAITADLEARVSKYRAAVFI
jgi:hypothetical protein